RWSRCLPGVDADEVAKHSHDLHRRHAAHVIQVLEAGIKEHARPLAERRLPESCLLRAVTGSSRSGLELPRQAVAETAVEPGPTLDHRNFNQTLDVEMGLAGDGRHVVFPGAGQISSTTICHLFEQLIEPYLHD